jgi:membrane protein
MKNHPVVQRIADAVWGEDVKSMSLIQRAAVRTARIFYTAVRDLSTGELNLRAMSLVFTTLLSIVPLLALSFSVLKGFGVTDQMEPLLEGLFSPLGDSAGEISSYILDFVSNAKVALLGTVGLGLLVYTAVSLLRKIEVTFNTIWKVPTRGRFALRIVEHMGILFIAPVIVFSILGLFKSAQTAAWYIQLMDFAWFAFLVDLAMQSASFVLTCAAFSFVYIYMPNTRVKLIPAISGGAIAAILWEIIRWAFASFVSGTNNYDAIYSGFAAGIFFLLWLYFSWMVLLLGSVCSFYIQYPQHLRFRSPPESLAGRELERVGLAVMTLLAYQFYHGLQPRKSEYMARRFGLPFHVISGVLRKLESCGYITRSDDIDESWLLTRDAASLLVNEIIRSLRHDIDSHAHGLRNELSEIDTIMAKAETAAATALGDFSLLDMVKTAELEVPDSDISDEDDDLG